MNSEYALVPYSYISVAHIVLKATRQRVTKAVEAAAVRSKATFNLQEQASTSTPTRKLTAKDRRRVSLGVAVDAATGKVVSSASHRKSRRKSTVLNSQQVHSRLKDAESKKVSIEPVHEMLALSRIINSTFAGRYAKENKRGHANTLTSRADCTRAGYGGREY